MIGIIHLSDIHIHDEKDLILKKVEKIYNATKNKLRSMEKVVIMITGDIAFSGMQDQYFTGINFFESLKVKLEDYINSNVEFLIVPGNHDCDFTDKKFCKVRTMIIKQIYQERELDGEIIEQCCEIQNNYRDFEELLENKDKKYKDMIFKIDEMFIEDKRIYFVGINMAWISEEKEQPNLFFPLDRYLKELESLDGITIAYLHQPTKWCHPMDSNILDETLSRYANIIFLGHEHTAKSFATFDNDDLVTYIKGGALQQKPKDEKSEFNLVVLDLSNLLIDIYNYKYNKDDTMYEEKNHSKYGIKNKNHNNPKFELDEEFNDFLEDLGANIIKNNTKKIYLNDVFIFPDLTCVSSENLDDNVGNEIIKNSEDLITLKDEEYIYISGEEKDGKTTLSKILFKKYYKQGLVPIYLDCEKIKYTKYNELNKVINKIFKKQYSEKAFKYFGEIDYREVVLIVDNFFKVSLDGEIREKFLNEIFENYAKVIIFGDEGVNIREILGKGNQSIFNSKFQHYALKEFGFKLKNKLIHKWNLIDNYGLTEKEILRKDKHAFKLINTVFGDNYIPSLPFYILVLLQSIEVGTQNSFQNSSYSYYYEFLIQQSILKITSDQGEIGACNNFMVSLAEHMYLLKLKCINFGELREFHAEYCKEYGIGEEFAKFKNYDRLIDNFIKTNLLRRNIYGEVSFAYKYIYYYYVGYHLAENISEKEIKQKIAYMIEHLYEEEYANILMFIIHNTKNPFILEKLLEKTRSIFNEYEIIKLNDNDLKFIQDVQMRIAPMTLKQVDIFKSRDEEYQKIDNNKLENNNNTQVKRELEKAKEEIAAGVIKEEFEEVDFTDELTLSPIDNINLCLKSMEILGQILKNYWGKLNAKTRGEIGLELYKVGLRGLNDAYTTIRNSEEELSNRIAIEMKGKDKLIPSEVKEKSNFMVYGFVVIFTYAFISKIVSTIGDINLDSTYKQISNELDCEAVELINLFIQLEFYNKGFPLEKVQEIYERYERYDVRNFILRSFVEKYLYLYSEDLNERENICRIFNVDRKSILMKKTIKK